MFHSQSLSVAAACVGALQKPGQPDLYSPSVGRAESCCWVRLFPTGCSQRLFPTGWVVLLVNQWVTLFDIVSSTLATPASRCRATYRAPDRLAQRTDSVYPQTTRCSVSEKGEHDACILSRLVPLPPSPPPPVGSAPAVQSRGMVIGLISITAVVLAVA